MKANQVPKLPNGVQPGRLQGTMHFQGGQAFENRTATAVFTGYKGPDSYTGALQ